MSDPAWKRAAIERLAAGSRVVSTAKGAVEFAEIGEGPALLALHGRPGGYDQGLLRARLGEGLGRWLAVSRPGYLRTPIDSGRSPAEQADLYKGLLDALRIGRSVVAGLSGGGPSALEFALRHPDRCRGLILVSAVTRRKDPRHRTLAQKLYDGVIGPSDQLSWRLFRLLGAGLNARGREGLATILILSESLRGEGRRNDLAQFAALGDDPPSGIRVPTLIVHGTADRMVPMAHAEAASRRISGARLVKVAGAGHDVFSRSAAVRSEVAAFVKDLPAGD